MAILRSYKDSYDNNNSNRIGVFYFNPISLVLSFSRTKMKPEQWSPSGISLPTIDL